MDRFGTHRALEPRGTLPQAAARLDVSLDLAPDEVLIDVTRLNIDSASWRQLRDSCGDDPDIMKAAILAIVSERGKMQNPVTGSGGMLVGTVAARGEHRSEPAIGARVATLVSLALTPLVLNEITSLDPGSSKVDVVGKAILFGSGLYVELPEDLPEDVALGVLDVCGAPAWIARAVRPGMNVVVIGAGGRSGILAGVQALRSLGGGGRVLGLCWPPETASPASAAGIEALAVDCTDATAVAEAVAEAFSGEAADLVVVCSNVQGCEAGAILACDDQGEVLFFSMATSFSAAALTAEGLGKSCRMTIGNGYVPGHAALALDLVRSSPELMARFSS